MIASHQRIPWLHVALLVVLLLTIYNPISSWWLRLWRFRFALLCLVYWWLFLRFNRRHVFFSRLFDFGSWYTHTHDGSQDCLVISLFYLLSPCALFFNHFFPSFLLTKYIYLMLRRRFTRWRAGSSNSTDTIREHCLNSEEKERRDNGHEYKFLSFFARTN